MQLRKTGTRKVENSTISLFIKTEIHQLDCMARWLYRPEGQKHASRFDFDVLMIKNRILALRTAGVLYDDEYESLMAAYDAFQRARKEAREAATSKATRK